MGLGDLKGQALFNTIRGPYKKEDALIDLDLEFSELENDFNYKAYDLRESDEEQE